MCRLSQLVGKNVTLVSDKQKAGSQVRAGFTLHI
jgi:hypothetical protein